MLAPVRGRVTDAGGIPLPGASVSVKGKKTSVATDGDGAFTLEAGEGDVLVITYIGYQSAEYKITGA
ncbi:carboxypeptidase-like regulatory domain-containing protein, partial [Chitinophaga sp.]|uniref:carboxypeptidase-like regulatory domain-containing protein n=1 Tax=Chitinophaga sp. TaxID=1869181 RepID=UPI002FDDC500